MNLKLANILQTVPDDTFQQLFASSCLTDENGDIILQEDGVSCISLENVNGTATAPDIEGIPVILGSPIEGNTLTATSATIIGNPIPAITWQWQESATNLGTVNKVTTDFTNTSNWTQVQTTRTGGQTGYDLSTDAVSVTRNIGGSLVLEHAASTTGLHTFEIYVKVNPSNGIALTFSNTSVNAYFNISDASQTSAVSSSGLVSSSQEYVGNDFYKLSITANLVSTGVKMFSLLADASTATSAGATFVLQSPRLVTGQPASFSDIVGETSNTYAVTASDAGNYLRVVQTATNTEGTDTETSVSTAAAQALSTTDADYQLVLDDATNNGYALPTETQQAHQNTLIEDLKTAGVWSKLDGLWLYANDASTADFALYNWVDKTRATVVNGLTHGGDGFTGTGGGKYINTNRVAGKTKNILIDSNQFDTTWLTSSATPISGYADRNGGTNAWLLRENATTSPHWVRQSSAITSGIGTFSFYAKKKDYDWIQFGRSGDGGSYANFNISNGTLGNSTIDFTDKKIESVGNGWYRCSVTYSFGSGAYVGISLIRSDVSSRYETYAGDVTKGTYIQDAQLEVGSTATEYIDSNQAVNFQELSASWGVFSNTEFSTTTTLQYAVSSDSSNQRLRYVNSASGGNRLASPSGALSSFAPSSTVGLMGMQKVGSGLLQGLQADGTLTSVDTGNGDTSLATATVKNLHHNGTSYSGNVGLCWVGDQFTATEWADFVTAVETYMTNKDS